MKKLSAILFILTLLVVSCQNGSNTSTTEVAVTHKEMNSEVVKTVANISIEGMTCSAGCGGKIQQDLQAVKGVTTTSLDFADGRPQNVVSVEYDPAVVNELDLIKTVNGISDGKYHVAAVEVVSYKGLTSASRGGGSDVGIDNFGKVFRLLNLLQSVARMIEG